MPRGFTPTPERADPDFEGAKPSARLVSGFTLIELLIYVAIFALVAGFFTGILIISLRVQGTQSGLVEVSTQLNFAIQTMQRHIREATGISEPGVGASGSTLTVSKPSGAVTITLGTCGAPSVASAVCVTEAGSTNPVTTVKIAVTALSFTHFSSPSGHPSLPPTETVEINITANNNTTNPAQLVTRTLRSAASPLKQ